MHSIESSRASSLRVTAAAIGQILLLLIVLLLALLGAKSWLPERAAFDSLVSFAVTHGGHDALGDTEAPLARRAHKDVAVGGGGSCVSEQTMVDAFGMGSHAIGDPKVCTSRV